MGSECNKVGGDIEAEIRISQNEKKVTLKEIHLNEGENK